MLGPCQNLVSRLRLFKVEGRGADVSLKLTAKPDYSFMTALEGSC